MFHYSKSRLVGISDGIFAVVLTIMVLDIKSPINESVGPMTELLKHLVIYFTSFGIVSQYWFIIKSCSVGLRRQPQC